MSDRRRKQPLVNRELFAQVGADSGALTMLAVVAHRFCEAGDYVGAVMRGEEEVGSFRLRADESSPATQVDIDLAALGPAPRRGDPGCDCGAEDSDPVLVVNPSGYALFHVSGGPGGYWVRVGRASEGEGAAFDSTRLDGEDLFMLTLLRPGTYSMRNTLTKAQGEIVVPYPKPANGPYRQPAPVEIDCGGKSFRPSRAKVQAGQGAVWRFEDPARIQLELVKPDDGPTKRQPKRTRPERKRST
jgi:hypothetical protein